MPSTNRTALVCRMGSILRLAVLKWLTIWAFLSAVDHSSAATPTSFSSLAVVTPSNPNHGRRRASIDASSNGFVGSVTLGNGGDFDVACDCGANWTVQRRRLNPDRPNHTALDDAPPCPTPNSYKIRQLSRKSSEDDNDDDDSNNEENGDDDDDDDETRPFNATQVISFLPLPSQLGFENISQSYLADIDGRATDAILGTPGGDIGEFILALQVYEDHLSILRTRHNLRANSTPMATISAAPSTSRSGGGNLTAGSVLQLLKAYLERTRPRKFYHRTSLDAIQHLQREIGHALNLDDPTTKDEARLLGRSCPRKTLRKSGGVCGLMHPMGIGDRHLRFM